MPRKTTTPEERAEAVEKAQTRARKGYRKNIKVDRKDLSDAEMQVIIDMLISLRVVGYSPTQCAHVVGLSKGQVRAICSEDDFKSRLESIKKKLPDAAITLGQAYLIEGVQAIVHVMRTERDNALVLKAVEALFDRFGLPKNSRSEVVNPEKPSAEEELSKSLFDTLRDAPPEIQEKVAALHESYLAGVTSILKSQGVPVENS